MNYEIEYTVHGITLDLVYEVDDKKVLGIEVFVPDTHVDIMPLLSLEEKWGIQKFVEGAWRRSKQLEA